MVIYMAKTTVILREDLHDILIKEAGKRRISEKINEILAEHLLKKKRKSLFGTMPKVDVSDLRDHKNRL